MRQRITVSFRQLPLCDALGELRTGWQEYAARASDEGAVVYTQVADLITAYMDNRSRTATHGWRRSFNRAGIAADLLAPLRAQQHEAATEEARKAYAHIIYKLEHL